MKNLGKKQYLNHLDNFKVAYLFQLFHDLKNLKTLEFDRKLSIFYYIKGLLYGLDAKFQQNRFIINDSEVVDELFFYSNSTHSVRYSLIYNHNQQTITAEVKERI